MKTKKCSVCGNDKPHSEFNKKSRNKDGLQSTCRECQREYKRKHYSENKQVYLEKVKERKDSLRSAALEKAVEYLETHPCVDCGESDIRKLQFDHMCNKHRDVTVMIHEGYTWDRIQEEIDKCEIRCANCHMVKTWPDRCKIRRTFQTDEGSSR